MAGVIRFLDVSFAYPGALEILTGLSFELAAKQALVISGASGAGKTTLARLAVGLLQPTAGRIEHGPVSVGERRRAAPAQLVFQDSADAFNPRLSLASSLAETRRSSEELHAAVELVGLDPGLLARRPSSLSGGERQRLGIARAVLARPSLLVADEPIANLDPVSAVEVIDALARTRDRLGCALLILSHRPEWFLGMEPTTARLSDRGLCS